MLQHQTINIKQCNWPIHQLVTKVYDTVFNETNQSAQFLASKWLQNMPSLDSRSCLFQPLVHKQQQELSSPLYTSIKVSNFKWKRLNWITQIYDLNTLRPTCRAMSAIKNITSATQWSQLISCSPIFSINLHSSTTSTILWREGV